MTGAEPDAAGVEIRDNPERSRYELRVDGELVGMLVYQLHDDTITMIHTEVNDAQGRHGLGTQLVRAALADAKARGLQVVPLCPFVAALVRREPGSYLELVAPGARAAVMDAEGDES